MKKLGNIDFGVFNNSVNFFLPIRYSLRDIEEIGIERRFLIDFEGGFFVQGDPALPSLQPSLQMALPKNQIYF
jgi:hypothetical protein